MNTPTLIIATYAVIGIVLIIVVLFFIKKRRVSNVRKNVERLDKEKNEIETLPILSELARVETIIKNDKMEEKYKSWIERFDYIKKIEIANINDMIINLDIFVDKDNHDEYMSRVAATEIELYKAKEKTNGLLQEIQDINLSEEKYRKIITKLKAKYRDLLDTFEKNKDNYEEIKEVMELQFENIEKRFQDFEEYMEVSDYTEVFHIVKAIDSMVDHMSLAVAEVPDLVLLASKLIPKKIEQITEIYEDMNSKNYSLKYLNLEYNIEESLKNINSILDKIKVLNLENCMFELKTILEYFESLFKEFDNEKKAKKLYEDEVSTFDSKFEKTNNSVKDIYDGLDEIKNMYDLSDKDVTIIDDVNKKIELLGNEYKNVIKDIKKKKISFSNAKDEVARLNKELIETEDELYVALKSLGNMQEDEERAREQLEEIQELLKQSKITMRSYKLPIVANNYFVELQEANEAILEIIKELEKKPISIKTLNTRVDTARDLVLKLFNTTNEMINTAKLVEMTLVYGNRYRCASREIDNELNNAEVMFYKGNYTRALETSIKAIEVVDSNIRKKVMNNLKKV